MLSRNVKRFYKIYGLFPRFPYDRYFVLSRSRFTRAQSNLCGR